MTNSLKELALNSSMTARKFIESIPLPILVIGPDQRVIAANSPLKEILGDELVSRHFIAALRQPLLVEAVEKAFVDRVAGEARYRVRLATKDLSFDVAIRPVDDQVILTFLDRTAAQEVGQLRRDFVANVSHELRTPLTALFGFIETLRGPARDDPSARDRFLGIMEREATRMIRLVDDLLSLSRVEEEERQRPADTVILGDLVRTAVAELTPMFESAAVTPVIADDSAGASIPADPRQLRQVIGNLIENAIKYGGDGKNITLSLSKPAYAAALRAEAVTLTVKDEGPGIAEHHIPRLTERFYRVDSHRNREVGGTGLGLAIVKHIVNRHRGRLQIASSPGEGTAMTVVLLTGP